MYIINSITKQVHIFSEMKTQKSALIATKRCLTLKYFSNNYYITIMEMIEKSSDH